MLSLKSIDSFPQVFQRHQVSLVCQSHSVVYPLSLPSSWFLRDCRDTGLLSVGSEINHYITLGLIFLPCVTWGGCRTHLLVPPHLSPPPRPFQLPHPAELGSASGSCIHAPSATGHPSLFQQFPHCTARWLIFSIFSELLEVRDHISHILESQVLCRVPGPQRVPCKHLMKWTQVGPKDHLFAFQS